MLNQQIAMIVEENHIIEMTYELRDGGPGGQLLERMDVNYPFKFFFGGGKMLPAFEEALYGLEEGEAFEFTLTPEQAYGPRHAGNMMEVPRSVFQDMTNSLIEGNYVELTDDQGDTHQGKITRIGKKEVKVDFNHAMAGKTLCFQGVILGIRRASIDELIRKHYIEEDGLRRPDFGETW